MEYKAIFFDMDGLLVDTEFWNFEAEREVLVQADIEFTEFTKEWYIENDLKLGRSCFDLMKERGMSDERIAVLRTRRSDRYAELLQQNVVPIEGVVEVLEELKGHFTMGVVTSARRKFFDLIMQKTEPLIFFDFFITREDVRNIKPNPEPYLKAVEISKQEKQHCLALEDSSKGVSAAKAAGINCYAIPDELTRTHDLSIADRILDSIRDIPAVVGVK